MREGQKQGFYIDLQRFISYVKLKFELQLPSWLQTLLGVISFQSCVN